jgi:methionyl-tRNA formyltransferase
MKKILCVSYRSWAIKIFDMLEESMSDHDFKIIRSKEDYSDEQLFEFDPDLVLWYGWSWKIPLEIINKYDCLCLHPSPLPKYRGGSPIQNQIINNEKVSAVTIFKMNEGFDDGDIIFQAPISLSGGVEDVFKRMEEIGFSATYSLISSGYSLTKQDHLEASVYKRRKQSDSEITIDEITNKPAEYIYNKIRMLRDPYPNAYIVDKFGRKLFITQAFLGED